MMMAASLPAAVNFASEAGRLLRGWSAFCTLPTTLHRWLCSRGWPLYGFLHLLAVPAINVTKYRQ